MIEPEQSHVFTARLADGAFIRETAIEFFDRVAKLAEAEGHHPDLHLTSFRNVSITVSTHAVGGLTRPDIILAAKLDAIPAEYSPKWLREHSPAPAK
jgi:4a-hydroxytetrahydrobiopterin dehydratase